LCNFIPNNNALLYKTIHTQTRYKQLLGKATDLNSAEFYAKKTHSKSELNYAEILLDC